jgi:putative hemolysin
LSSDPIWGHLLLQLALIAVNAFFAATEIAVISLNENKIRRLAEEGDAKAKQLLHLVQAPNGFLSTIQVGITLAGFLGSAFAADNFASRLTNWLVNDLHVAIMPRDTLKTLSVILITLILSYFTLVLGELAPKRVALQKPEKVARLTCGVISFLARVTKPIIVFLSVSTNGVLRLIGINPHQEGSNVTEEEIRMMVDIGEEKGAIETNERDMIENIFEFNNSSAEDVMIHRTDVASIWIQDTPETIVKTILDTGLSRFPVYEEDIDDVIGILYTRDYLLNEHTDPPKPLRGLLREAYFVPETVQADVLFREMQRRKVHLAVVVDEYGGMSGIVTMEDLLEEIVGSIYDEFDPAAKQEITPIGDNQWRVAGTVDLETLSEALNVTLPLEEEYDTLGGLIYNQLTTIPQDGSHPEVTVCGLRIYVEELLEHRVETAIITKLKPPEETKEEQDA